MEEPIMIWGGGPCVPLTFMPLSLIRASKCHFADKGPYSQSYSFSSIHVWVSELDHKEC